MSEARRRWAVILAGGEGVRLRPLTMKISGDERPKQFCRLLAGETLLDSTRRRAALAVPARRTLLVVTAAHRRYFAPLVNDVPAGSLVVQPASRGTAPAILYALLRIAAVDPLAGAVILPSDHHVSDEALFMAQVEVAFAAAERRPDLIVLLGIAPDRAEPDYGWIEPGEPIVGPVRRVRRFREKPDPRLAHALLVSGALWNSFVIVAGVPALLSLVRRTEPALLEAFAQARAALGTPGEPAAMEAVYAGLPRVNFSSAVLGPGAADLAVLPVQGVEWSDWGRPERVLASMTRLGVKPAWLQPGLACSA